MKAFPNNSYNSFKHFIWCIKIQTIREFLNIFYCLFHLQNSNQKYSKKKMPSSKLKYLMAAKLAKFKSIFWQILVSAKSKTVLVKSTSLSWTNIDITDHIIRPTKVPAVIEKDCVTWKWPWPWHFSNEIGFCKETFREFKWNSAFRR